MKKNYFMVLGILLIFLGIIGFFAMNVNTIKTIGYITFNNFLDLNNASNNSFEFSDVNNIIVRGGDKTKVTLTVKNIRDKAIINCKLLPKSLAEWISNTQIENIFPNKKVNFELELNIPPTNPGVYEAEVEIKCDEEFPSETKKFNINVLGQKSLEIVEISEKNKKINVSYVFNNENFFGDTVFVEIWVENSDGFEIKRVIDSFPIRKDSLIERSELIDLDEVTGIYDVYIALSSDLDNYLKESIIVGESFISGRGIIKVAKGKGFPYLIFLLIIGIGVFFIFKSHRENIQKTNENQGEEREY